MKLAVCSAKEKTQSYLGRPKSLQRQETNLSLSLFGSARQSRCPGSGVSRAGRFFDVTWDIVVGAPRAQSYPMVTQSAESGTVCQVRCVYGYSYVEGMSTSTAHTSTYSTREPDLLVEAAHQQAQMEWKTSCTSTRPSPIRWAHHGCRCTHQWTGSEKNLSTRVSQSPVQVQVKAAQVSPVLVLERTCTYITKRRRNLRGRVYPGRGLDDDLRLCTSGTCTYICT